MKRYHYLLLFMGLLGCTTCELRAEDKPAGEPGAGSAKGLAVVWVGEEDQALLERAVDFVQGNFACAVRVKPRLETMPAGLDKVAAELAKLKTEDDLYLLALWNEEPADPQFREGLSAERGVAVLNVRALKPADMDDDAAGERYGRRVEKQSMRMFGLLMGLQACPFPRCALWDSAGMEQLDMKGRNFCPPCSTRARDVLLGNGVTVDYRRYSVPVASPLPAAGGSAGQRAD